MRREHFNFNTVLITICLGLVGYLGQRMIVKVDSLTDQITEIRIQATLNSERLKSAETTLANQARQLNMLLDKIKDKP